MDLLQVPKSTAIATRPVGHLLRWLSWHLDPQARRPPERAPTGAALRFYSLSAGTIPKPVRLRERI